MDTTHEKLKGSEEWYTPPEIVKALGKFDLDPCAAPAGGPIHAQVNYRKGPQPEFTLGCDIIGQHQTSYGDGLELWITRMRWDRGHSRVWLNPPYGKETGAWLKRMAEHANGVALVFARTDTQAFFDHVWGKASGIFFLKGRMKFLQLIDGKLQPKGRAGAASVLISYDRPGEWENANALKSSGLAGYFVDLTPTEVVWSGWACAIRSVLQFGPLTLQEIYHWVERSVHRPQNKHIRAKIRQILNSRNADLFCKTDDDKWTLQRYEQ